MFCLAVIFDIIDSRSEYTTEIHILPVWLPAYMV